jgi:hypothetical protein
MQGTFRGRVVGEVVLGTSSQKGTPFIQFYGEVTQDGDFKGKRARYDGYFTSNTEERTLESLLICGWTGDDLSEFTDGKLHGLDTNEVDFVIEEEEYEDENGNPRTASKIKWINRAGGGGKLFVENAMSEAAAKAFGAKMRGLVLKSRRKSAPKNSAAPPNRERDSYQGSRADDDIPFDRASTAR